MPVNTPATIDKSEQEKTLSTVTSYEMYRQAFSWPGIEPGTGLNIACQAVERHADATPDNTALRIIKDDKVEEFSYALLAELTGQFANLLYHLDLGNAPRVFTLLGACPELFISCLGSLKAGMLFCPLYEGLGPDPVRVRLDLGNCSVLVTNERLYKRIQGVVSETALQHVLLIDNDIENGMVSGFWPALKKMDPRFAVGHTEPLTPALLHFTSGTTGTPKGAIHTHQAIVAVEETARAALDLRTFDTYWCTGTPGWITGTMYGTLAPLSVGATNLVFAGEFNPAAWLNTLQDHGVDIWYTTPTAVRLLRRLHGETPVTGNLKLRFAATVGEPLHASDVEWGQRVFGIPFHDTWWQTETGCIILANYRSMAIKPGAAGKPVAGVEVAIIHTDAGGKTSVTTTGPAQGELGIRSGWPSMFTGYLHDDKRYQECFTEGWYQSGDLFSLDKDGYFRFLGRKDDVIKSAGHLVGPNEIEQVLVTHPAVSEVAIVGCPDPIIGESIKAFIVVVPGTKADFELDAELQDYAREHLGAAMAPRQLEFVDKLPKTFSGKIIRRTLRSE